MKLGRCTYFLFVSFPFDFYPMNFHMPYNRLHRSSVFRCISCVDVTSDVRSVYKAAVLSVVLNGSEK